MTFNLRYPAPDPGYLWPDRLPAMLGLLNRERPCVIGTQEGYDHQLVDLLEGLGPPYQRIGCGREGGTEGEHAAVLVDTDRLQVLDSANRWLSDAPDVPGSTSWGNTLPRMLTWVRLRGEAGEFVLINTHFDHEAEAARVRSAQMLAQVAASFAPTPVVITGDFNAAAGASEPYRVLTHDLADAWDGAEVRLTPAYGTFAEYSPAEEGTTRIDWILCSRGVRTRVAAINPCTGLDPMPSDHLPVQAVLSWV